MACCGFCKSLGKNPIFVMYWTVIQFHRYIVRLIVIKLSSYV